jgi:methylthioribose-1-phosphate isomerase
MRTVFWNYDNDTVNLIDQRKLPWEFEVAAYDDYHEVARAITEMVVRGAPAIGATAAFGMALAARQSRATDRLALLRDLEEAAKVLNAARPTAVNLSWAVHPPCSAPPPTKNWSAPTTCATTCWPSRNKSPTTTWP